MRETLCRCWIGCGSALLIYLLQAGHLLGSPHLSSMLASAITDPIPDAAADAALRSHRAAPHTTTKISNPIQFTRSRPICLSSSLIFVAPCYQISGVNRGVRRHGQPDRAVARDGCVYFAVIWEAPFIAARAVLTAWRQRISARPFPAVFAFGAVEVTPTAPNHTVQRTRLGRFGFNRSVHRAGSLTFTLARIER
jgi:hypothetical protein